MTARRPVAKTSPKTTAKRAKPKAVQPKRNGAKAASAARRPARPAPKTRSRGETFKKVAVGVLALQGIVAYEQMRERNSKYESAQAYAKNAGKGLLVVGGPFGSPNNRLTGLPAHGWGAVCLDVDPTACAGAPPGCTVVEGDIRNMTMFRNKQFGAVFVSHILEHLPSVGECERALAELHRVADRVFVVSPSKGSLRDWIHSGHHLWVGQQSDGTVRIEQR